jgi:hypothetical protein
VRCPICSPIRDNASRRDGRVRADGVKVKRVRVKRAGVVSSQNSNCARRKAQIEAVSMCEMRADRMPSSRQRWRSIGLALAITCTCRLEKGLGYCGL